MTTLRCRLARTMALLPGVDWKTIVLSPVGLTPARTCRFRDVRAILAALPVPSRLPILRLPRLSSTTARPALVSACIRSMLEGGLVAAGTRGLLKAFATELPFLSLCRRFPGRCGASSALRLLTTLAVAADRSSLSPRSSLGLPLPRPRLSKASPSTRARLAAVGVLLPTGVFANAFATGPSDLSV